MNGFWVILSEWFIFVAGISFLYKIIHLGVTIYQDKKQQPLLFYASASLF